MSSALNRLFGLHEAALSARTYRSQVLASNIANADTPGFQARDVDFKTALGQALGATAPADATAPVTLARTSSGHMGVGGAQGSAAAAAPLIYRTVTQASIDNNTVDVNVERAQFADNAMRYEASLTFVNSKIKGLLAAMQS